MAITIGQVNLPNRNHVVGNRREVVVDITLDASYATGGYALTYATLGVDGVPDYVFAPQAASGHSFGYDYANQKLKVYLGGTEIANATDLHTVTARLIAHGKGNPIL